MSTPLWRALTNLAVAPASHLDGVARTIESSTDENSLAQALINQTPLPSRSKVSEMVEAARAELGVGWSKGLPAAIRSIAAVRAAADEREAVELVWTGPEVQRSTFRRTDRAWIDLIDEATRDIWLASYSTSPGEDVQDALVRAIERGVDVRILLETPEDSGGRMTLDGTRRFKAAIRMGANFYRWPLDQRRRSFPSGTPQMHAKCIVIDQQAMFVTSANLSGAALERNIEVGVIVKGGLNPAWLAGRFNELLHSGAIIAIDLS